MPENEVNWNEVGDHALSCWKISTAKLAYELAGGVGALLLLTIAMGDFNSIELGHIKR